MYIYIILFGAFNFCCFKNITLLRETWKSITHSIVNRSLCHWTFLEKKEEKFLIEIEVQNMKWQSLLFTFMEIHLLAIQVFFFYLFSLRLKWESRTFFFCECGNFVELLWSILRIRMSSYSYRYYWRNFTIFLIEMLEWAHLRIYLKL